MTGEVNDGITRKICDFLTEIGLNVEYGQIDGETFLPGIQVRNGGLFVDESRLKYPGDLLHEAGHLALAEPELRSTLSGEVAFPGIIMEPVEAAAIAWSYAVAVHLGIDPAVVFHEGGYRGDSQKLLFNFSVGVYIGLSGLEAADLAYSPVKAAALNIPPYPAMRRWIRVC